MDEVIFTENFGEYKQHETYLCYEVQLFEDDSQVPVKEFKSFLRNQVTYHSRQSLPILGHSGRRFSAQGMSSKHCPFGPRSCCGFA